MEEENIIRYYVSIAISHLFDFFSIYSEKYFFETRIKFINFSSSLSSHTIRANVIAVIRIQSALTCTRVTISFTSRLWHVNNWNLVALSASYAKTINRRRAPGIQRVDIARGFFVVVIPSASE